MQKNKKSETVAELSEKDLEAVEGGANKPTTLVSVRHDTAKALKTAKPGKYIGEIEKNFMQSGGDPTV